MDNRFSIGSVLGNGFRIWFKNLIPFTLMGALFFAPIVLWWLSLIHQDPTDVFAWLQQLQRYAIPLFALELLATLMLSTALTYGVVMELQGSHASIGACIATGLARFFPVLGVALLAVVIIGAGMLALLVPGLILYCMLYVATQVAVLERVGITGALGRSRDLTSGKKLEIFGLLVILGLINFGLGQIIETVLFDKSTLTPETFMPSFRRVMYAKLVQTTVWGSITAVMAAVAYFQLRNEKEGTSADELAAVFE